MSQVAQSSRSWFPKKGWCATKKGPILKVFRNVSNLKLEKAVVETGVLACKSLSLRLGGGQEPEVSHCARMRTALGSSLRASCGRRVLARQSSPTWRLTHCIHGHFWLGGKVSIAWAWSIVDFPHASYQVPIMFTKGSNFHLECNPCGVSCLRHAAVADEPCWA